MITPIHFVHIGETSSANDWRIACMPGMTEFHATAHHTNYPRSDDVRAVTCPACKKSNAYKKSKDLLEEALKKVMDGK